MAQEIHNDWFQVVFFNSIQYKKYDTVKQEVNLID